MSEKKKRLKYTEKQMADALDAVENQGMSRTLAAKTFSVPKTTLLDKLSGRVPRGRVIGHPPYLTNEEEKEIVSWIKQGNKRGLPPHKEDIINTAQRMVQAVPGRYTPFPNGRPGYSWWQGFRKRHEELSIRTTERVSRARAGISELSIRMWFEQLRRNLTDLNAMDIFNDPTRVYNADETNIQLCPKTGKAIGIKGWKNCYEICSGPEKSTLTFLGTFSASGEVVAPTMIYPYVRIPRDITDQIPSDFNYVTTESGWMTSEAFFNFVLNIFNKWLDTNRIKRPVILFVDGHRTHLTLQLSVKCEEVGIILYLLPPNSTHLLQPADVGPFKPLKHFWRKEVRKYQQDNPEVDLKRRDVAPLLKNALSNVSKESIVNGFLRTGLFPLNVEEVDYSKMLDVDIVEDEPSQTTDKDTECQDIPQVINECTAEEYKTAQKVIEEVLGPLKTRENRYSRVSITLDLFNLYQNIKTKAQNVAVPVEDVIVLTNGSVTVHDSTQNPIDILHQPFTPASPEGDCILPDLITVSPSIEPNANQESVTTPTSVAALTKGNQSIVKSDKTFVAPIRIPLLETEEVSIQHHNSMGIVDIESMNTSPPKSNPPVSRPKSSESMNTQPRSESSKTINTTSSPETNLPVVRFESSETINTLPNPESNYPVVRPESSETIDTLPNPVSNYSVVRLESSEIMNTSLNPESNLPIDRTESSRTMNTPPNPESNLSIARSVSFEAMGTPPYPRNNLSIARTKPSETIDTPPNLGNHISVVRTEFSKNMNTSPIPESNLTFVRLESSKIINTQPNPGRNIPVVRLESSETINTPPDLRSSLPIARPQSTETMDTPPNLRSTLPIARPQTSKTIDTPPNLRSTLPIARPQTSETMDTPPNLRSTLPIARPQSPETKDISPNLRSTLPIARPQYSETMDTPPNPRRKFSKSFETMDTPPYHENNLSIARSLDFASDISKKSDNLYDQIMNISDQSPPVYISEGALPYADDELFQQTLNDF